MRSSPPPSLVGSIRQTVTAARAIYRPHARDVVHPARGAAGDGDHPQPGIRRALQTEQRLGDEAPLPGERVVDVAEHAAQPGQRTERRDRAWHYSTIQVLLPVSVFIRSPALGRAIATSSWACTFTS